jgi:hypothetical protein
VIVGVTSTYGSCHGHDCVKVGVTSTYDSCHGHDCVIVGSHNHDHDSYHR